ncbi:protein kinase [Alcanivorax sp.]|uniref:protein kinase domain-containing protein n=1 Tax=Alcanivorax sp. TaxID=1872427 RepID=UPI0025BF1E08|nr:protein kinase [Alcanivorax sp.]
MAKNIKYRKNQTIGDWKLSYKLGSGGNGEVWSVKDGNDSYAIKLLKKIRPTIYNRFRSEVEAMEKNQDISGVIPLVDKFLPEDVGDQVPWFVMPQAIKFSEWRKGKTVLEIVEGMLGLANTLHQLHQREFHHRDIKPANILFLKNRLFLSDFGLVKYPGRIDITKEGLNNSLFSPLR